MTLNKRNMQKEIIPAVLVDDFEEFQERVEEAERFAETVQWDIMDGQFVENQTFSDIAALQQVDTVLSVEVHLMVENPEELLDELAQAGIDRVIVHGEAAEDLPGLIEKMKSYEFEVGVALNPETEVEEIEEVIDQLDQVLVMTVIPGAGGQSFMEDQLAKVRLLREKYPELHIGVDGGVNQATIQKAKEAGANRFCVNSAIFASPDPANAYAVLLSLVENGD